MSATEPDGWTAAQLAQAAEHRQLELHYQPIVDLRRGRIASAEALLRWRHPSLGLLPPGAFLPRAEASGLALTVGDVVWVLPTHTLGTGLPALAGEEEFPALAV